MELNESTRTSLVTISLSLRLCASLMAGIVDWGVSLSISPSSLSFMATMVLVRAPEDTQHYITTGTFRKMWTGGGGGQRPPSVLERGAQGHNNTERTFKTSIRCLPPQWHKWSLACCYWKRNFWKSIMIKFHKLEWHSYSLNCLWFQWVHILPVVMFNISNSYIKSSSIISGQYNCVMHGNRCVH